MAEKKEGSVSPANEKLQLWLSFAKFFIAVFFISVTLIEMTKQDARARVKIAELGSDCSGDGEGDDMEHANAKELYFQGVDRYIHQDMAGAIQSWEKALKLDPDYEDAKKNIVRARAKLKALEPLKK